MNTSFAALTDPFAMLLKPEQVMRAIERSDRLARLHGRIHRPLDKPLIPRVGDKVQDFDRLIDEAPEESDAE